MYDDESQVIRDTSVNAFDFSSILSRVFIMMTLGLVVTGISAFIVASSETLLMFAMNTMIIWIISELVLVLVLGFAINKMSPNACRLAFYAYAIVNGITLSTIFIVYSGESITSVFFITAAMFASAAFYGKKTKADLTKMGTFFLMALVGLIIAGIVEIFIVNSTFSFIVAAVGVVIFAGLTAYDVKKIEYFSTQLDTSDERSVTRLVTWGALELYLDFINMFLKLLRILGKRRN